VAEWQPIKTAPRDGTNILLAWGQDRVSQGKFIPGLPKPWQFIDTNDGITWLINHAVDNEYGPTHWQPMPKWSRPNCQPVTGGSMDWKVVAQWMADRDGDERDDAYLLYEHDARDLAETLNTAAGMALPALRIREAAEMIVRNTATMGGDTERVAYVEEVLDTIATLAAGGKAVEGGQSNG